MTSTMTAATSQYITASVVRRNRVTWVPSGRGNQTSVYQYRGTRFYTPQYTLSSESRCKSLCRSCVSSFSCTSSSVLMLGRWYVGCWSPNSSAANDTLLTGIDLAWICLVFENTRPLFCIFSFVTLGDLEVNSTKPRCIREAAITIVRKEGTWNVVLYSSFKSKTINTAGGISAAAASKIQMTPPGVERHTARWFPCIAEPRNTLDKEYNIDPPHTDRCHPDNRFIVPNRNDTKNYQ